LTPPARRSSRHPWQVDEVRQLRDAGASLAVVSAWASAMWSLSVTVLTRQVARRRN
jgi:hypothetical protein